MKRKRGQEGEARSKCWLLMEGERKRLEHQEWHGLERRIAGRVGEVSVTEKCGKEKGKQ